MSLLDPQLQAFEAIAKFGTVHAAAEDIYLTQTAVTQRLKGLEKKLGASLFTRSRRGMILTTEGEALLRYCQAAKALEGETLARISGEEGRQTVKLSIAGPTSVMQARVLPVVTQILHQQPNLSIEMLYRDNQEAIHLLKNGNSQLAILPAELTPKEVEFKPLVAEKFLLVASPKWKKRKLKDILQKERIIDFNVGDEATFTYLQHYDLMANANTERHFANHPEAIVELIQAQAGYSVLEKSFAKPLIDNGELIVLNKGLSFDLNINLAWFPRPLMPDYFKDVIEGIE